MYGCEKLSEYVYVHECVEKCFLYRKKFFILLIFTFMYITEPLNIVRPIWEFYSSFLLTTNRKWTRETTTESPIIKSTFQNYNKFVKFEFFPWFFIWNVIHIRYFDQIFYQHKISIERLKIFRKNKTRRYDFERVFLTRRKTRSPFSKNRNLRGKMQISEARFWAESGAVERSDDVKESDYWRRHVHFEF